jgi:hypothetical protein
MGDKSGGKYEHEHSKTSEWPGEQQVNDILGVRNDSRDVHHHTITDTSTGNSGTGSGWTHSEAKDNAQDDLKSK